MANSGPLLLTAPCTKCGYFRRNHAASEPGYDPPNAIHLVSEGRWCLAFIATINEARSASACSDERNTRFSVERSLKFEQQQKNEVFEKQYDLLSTDYLLRRMTFAIESVFQLKKHGIVFLGIMCPGTLFHPLGGGFSFTANHQENRTARFVKFIVCEISLL